MAGKASYKKTAVELHKKKVTVYASPKIAVALDLIGDMSLYEGVKMIQLLEALYDQGKKDGASAAFSEIEKGMKEAIKAVPHKNPGKPKKSK